MTSNYTIRSMSLNLRNAKLGRPDWSASVEGLVRIFTQNNPSILYLQEVARPWLLDLKSRMPGWQFCMSQNCAVGWDDRKWYQHGYMRHTLVGPQDRGFAAVRVCPRMKPGEELQPNWWACSTQLTSMRPDAFIWRRRQFKQIAHFFKRADMAAAVQMGADLNINRLVRPSIRDSFAKIGLVGLGKVAQAEEDIMSSLPIENVAAKLVDTGRLTEGYGLLSVAVLEGKRDRS